jgi:hypothetical protein
MNGDTTPTQADLTPTFNKKNKRGKAMERIEKVIIIYEECHGVIGVAVDLQSAIRWLIQTDWIDARKKFWVNKQWQPIGELFGERWRERLVEQDKEFFEGNFYFNESDLIGAIYD